MPTDHLQTFGARRRAAEDGDPAAQFDLAVHFGLGLGVSQDYAEAVRWYRAAAEQGETRAQNNLGWMYGTGRGVPQDFAHAYAWYSVAAAAGNDLARRNRDAVAAQMAPSQVEAAQRLSAEIFERLQRA